MNLEHRQDIFALLLVHVFVYKVNSEIRLLFLHVHPGRNTTVFNAMENNSAKSKSKQCHIKEKTYKREGGMLV